MRFPSLSRSLAGMAVALTLWVSGQTTAAPPTSGPIPALDSASCLNCHEAQKAHIEVASKDGESRKLGTINTKKFSQSAHGQLNCLDCHHEITDSKAQHSKAPGVAPPNCVTCHEKLWAQVDKGGMGSARERLGLVVTNMHAYKNSFHARPDADDPSKPKAFCEDCHSSHAFMVPDKNDPKRNEWRKDIPATCGAKCHEEQLELYTDSIHGHGALKVGDPKAAVCTDCHTTHAITNTSSEQFKLTNVNACGNCHKNELKAYTDTYHGQVNRLGYTYTARCVDCHDSHGIRGVNDPASKVHPNNRLKTCQKCHSDKKPGMHDATPGFLSFGPHATTHDFDKYPEMWIASKFMIGLLIGVFAFFWLHSGLWYYREWQDRKEGKGPPHIDISGLNIDPKKHFQRFPWGWRLAHLLFALVTMTLVLTGTSALYAQSAWAPVVAQAVGGPKVLGLIHRIAASLFIGIFMIHFVYVMQKLLRDKNFRWFGPDSLIPNWKDLADCWGMFKWFLGKGPRPQFERWAYYEKFDYWAVFWGVNIIGWSGLMLAFPHVTAQFLPGWIFNVATLVHGEEAFLAAVFLFTVHFFNNHFRPDKLPPPDVVMFTGTQSLDEFRHDHPAHYRRMVESGDIHKYLVDAPSKSMHTASVVLGLALITLGLTLLVLVGSGFFNT